jgi:hypothetical protein
MKYVLRKNSQRHSVIVKEFSPSTETFRNITYIGSAEAISLHLNPNFVGCVVEYMGVEQSFVESFGVRFIGLSDDYLNVEVVPRLWQCDLYGNRFFEVLQTRRDVLVAVACELKFPIPLEEVRDGLWTLNPFRKESICTAAVLVKNGKIVDFVQSYGDIPEKLKINADGLSIVRTPSSVEEPRAFVFDH